MAEFVARLDEINELADRSPGFVWRLQTGEGNALAVRAFEDERIFTNLSVWSDVASLARYVYHGPHRELLRERGRWFEPWPQPGPSLVLWHVPAGLRPDAGEARRRLETLARLGPTAQAFTFASRFPPPDGPTP